MSIDLFLILTLTIKHFVVDFLLQPSYEWKNKGTCGHWGGIIHSGKHALASFFLLFGCAYFWSGIQFQGTVLPYTPGSVVLVSVIEFLIHYHMDWAKVNINKIKGWGANTHPEFWYLLGFDQLVHSLTYILMAWMLLDGAAIKTIQFFTSM